MSAAKLKRKTKSKVFETADRRRPVGLHIQDGTACLLYERACIVRDGSGFTQTLSLLERGHPVTPERRDQKRPATVENREREVYLRYLYRIAEELHDMIAQQCRERDGHDETPR